MTEVDPLRSDDPLQSGQSVESRFCELEHLKAAVGELTQPAICGHWIIDVRSRSCVRLNLVSGHRDRDEKVQVGHRQEPGAP